MSDEQAETIDIEALMAQIRQQIEAQKESLAEEGPGAGIPTGGGRFPPAFYEHLRQAQLAHDQLQPSIQLAPVSLPLIGPLLGWFRQKAHELVLFYVNQLATNQIRVNSALLQALLLLSQELDEESSERANG